MVKYGDNQKVFSISKNLMFVFTINITPATTEMTALAVGGTMKIYQVAFPAGCSSGSGTCTEGSGASYQLYSMLHSSTGGTSHDELLFFGSQRSAAGLYSPRVDKITASDFDDDLARRNILLTAPSDSTEL